MNLWRALHKMIQEDDKFFDTVVKIWKEMEELKKQEIPPKIIVTSIIKLDGAIISNKLAKAFIKAGYPEEKAAEKSTNLIFSLL